MKKEQITNELFDFAETLLEENKTLVFRMQGYSMYPTMKNGDKSSVIKCLPEEVKVGDIVVFKLNNKYIAHRLLKIKFSNNKHNFIAKGDNNSHYDPPFTDNELIGKVATIMQKDKTNSTSSFKHKLKSLFSVYLPNLSTKLNKLNLNSKNRISVLYSSFSSLFENFKLISKHAEKLIWLNGIIAVLQGILPFVLIVCIKSLIDNLTKTTMTVATNNLTFIVLLVITAFVFLASGVVNEIRSYFAEKMSQLITQNVYEKLHSKHISLDLSHHENPKELDKMHRAIQEASYRPIKIINELLTGIKSIAASVFLLAVFLTIKWYLVLLLFIAIIPSVLFRIKFSRKFHKLKESQSTEERELYYFNRVLTGFPFAKEIKLFGFADFFLQKFKGNQQKLFSEKLSLRKEESKWNIGAQIFSIILIFISLAYVSYLKINGAISIGTVVLFFFAFQRGYSVLNDLFRSFTLLMEDNAYLNDFIAFLNIPNKTITSGDAAKFSLKKEMIFENVSFKYETSKRNVLTGINLTIPAGKTVAIVGANGSGKTTLIKLVCGFYQPVSGKILFDGIDAATIGQQKICENLAAVFQDFALYNLMASTNIALGDVYKKRNEVKIKKAAQDADLAAILEKLPNGYQTILGNLFAGGEELSIGQWQKLAIARAFYRDAPLLLLDEPSSALDANSEAQIINTLQKLSQDKTAIIISHRLTTVQWVDIIYLFDEGKIIESGNHKDLMALEGKYFQLFQTASERFVNE